MAISWTTNFFVSYTNKKVSPQLTLSCFYDYNIYTTETTVLVSETQSGECKESYAYSMNATNNIVLSLTNIVIDCSNSNNNLRLVGTDKTYTFCGSTAVTSYTFVSSSSYVAIQKFCQVSFTLKSQFISNYNSCNNSPCLNGGTCTTTGTSYTCACTSFYYGTNCQIRKLCPLKQLGKFESRNFHK